MQFTDLVGFQLLSLTDESMVVVKDKETYVINFECDHGDCCGYANINNTLLFDPKTRKKNPVITNIAVENSGEYSESIATITLFGENKQIAQINAEAGSGSGWNYGACVTVTCNQLEIHEDIVCY